MEKYLLKLSKINQKITDESDFYTFLQASKAFLKLSDNHEAYKDEIVKALKKIKNKYVLRMVYEIAAEMKVKECFINLTLIQKHLKSSLTTSGILMYLMRYNIQDFNNQILKKLIKKRLRVDGNLFEFVKNNRAVANEFLNTKKEELVYIQLKMISETGVFANIMYFVIYLGDTSKLICIQAFEAFNRFFEDIEKLGKDKLKLVLDDLNLTNHVLCINNKYYLSTIVIKNKPKNISNLVKYGSAFFQQKDLCEYISKYNDQNTSYDHVNCANCNTINKESFKRCHRSNKESPKLNDDFAFDFLFASSCNKDVCDCYEI